MKIYNWMKKQKMIVRVLIILTVAFIAFATGSAISFYTISLRHYHEISGYVEDASVETVEVAQGIYSARFLLKAEVHHLESALVDAAEEFLARS